LQRLYGKKKRKRRRHQTKAWEDALKEQGKEEIRMEIAREKAVKREEHVEMTNRMKFGPKP
jgi:hypothetical protein